MSWCQTWTSGELAIICLFHESSSGVRFGEQLGGDERGKNSWDNERQWWWNWLDNKVKCCEEKNITTAEGNMQHQHLNSTHIQRIQEKKMKCRLDNEEQQMMMAKTDGRSGQKPNWDGLHIVITQCSCTRTLQRCKTPTRYLGLNLHVQVRLYSHIACFRWLVTEKENKNEEKKKGKKRRRKNTWQVGEKDKQ